MASFQGTGVDSKMAGPAFYAGSASAAAHAGLHDYARQSRSPRRAGQVLGWYAAADALALLIGLAGTWGMALLMTGAMPESGLIRSAEFAAIAAVVLIWFQQAGHYRMCMPFWIEAGKIVSALACAALADGLLQPASGESMARLWLLSGWMIAAVAMILLRHMARAWLRKTGRFQMRTLLVGSGVTAQHTREALASDPCLAYQLTAQIQDLPKAFLRAGRSWETLCAMHGAQYVIIALDGHELAPAAQPLAQLAREPVPFSVSPPLHHLPVSGMAPHYVMNHDVMLLSHSSGLEQPLPCFLKRAFDVAVSAMALFALSPLMLALALWVKSDGGPAFYAHMRLGRNKKPFPCFKFRSMVMNGDEVLKRHLAENPKAREEWENTQKLVNDPRVTPVGRFLRGSSLDELPQLINVLRGEMSLVGPRPIVSAEVTKYDGDIAHYCRVRPGVTGLWQVSGRSDVSYPRRVHMDSWYVRNWSLWHDIAILCKTIPALLNRTGAY